MNKILKELLNERKEEIKGRLYHITQIKFSYNSNHIEGSSLSEEQTRHIYQTNSFISDKDSIVKVDDVIETLNHFKAFDYILDNIDILNENLIKELHRILKENTSDNKKEWFNVGEYKKLKNYVGNKLTISPKDVKKEIQQLLENYNTIQTKKIEDIIEFHYKFEKIHPFQDGNGRVGRLIMFKECLRNNITPFIIDEKHKLFYYRGLKEYENEKGWLLDTCLSAQDEYLILINSLEEDENGKENSNDRR